MRHTAAGRHEPRPFLGRPLLVASCLAVLLTAACGSSEAGPQAALSASGTPSGPDASGSAGTEPTSPPSESQTSSPSIAVTPDPPAGTVITVAYAEGEATGDTGRVEIAVGEPVTLRVTSDVQEEIHVHGVDLYVDLAPGVESVTEFTQDAPGIFEIELHDSGGVLTRVQVE